MTHDDYAYIATQTHSLEKSVNKGEDPLLSYLLLMVEAHCRIEADRVRQRDGSQVARRK